MSSIPGEALQPDLEKTAVLEMLTYLDFNVDIKRGDVITVYDIMESAKHSTKEGNAEYLAIINSYISQHPEFKNIQLTDQSIQTDPAKVGIMTDPDGFNGYTFYDQNEDDYYVAFSGTPENCWGQNADAFGPARDNTYYTYAKIYDEVV